MNAFELAAQLRNMAVDGADGTISAQDEPLPRSGYFVGGVIPSLVFKGASSIDRGELAYWIGSNEPTPFYEVWVDTDTNKVYFDGVDHVNYLVGAKTLAQMRGEIAVWDIVAGAEVRLVANEA